MSVVPLVLNRFACLFAFWAIALNAAVGFAGPMVFSEHKAGDSHIVSHAGNSEEGAFVRLSHRLDLNRSSLAIVSY